MSRIYVAGHRGMVGSAIVRRLRKQDGVDLITATHSELDLTNQAAVQAFFAEHRCESYNRQYGRYYHSVMPTNLYGPHDNFQPKTAMF